MNALPLRVAVEMCIRDRGYTGANWTVAVIKQAAGIGLDDGNDEFVGSKAVTREAVSYTHLQIGILLYLRPGAYKTHIPPQHVEQLGQLVQLGLAQDSACLLYTSRCV